MDEMFGFMDSGETAEPQTAPPVPAPDDPISVIVPEIVNGALAPQAGADPLAEAHRLMDPWKARLPQLRDFSGQITVTTQDDLGIATKVVSRLKRLEKEADAARKSLVDPLNKRVKSINAVFAVVAPEVKTAWQTIQSKMQSFTARLELERRKAQEEANRAVKEVQEKLNAEAKTAGVEAPTIQAPIVQPAPRTIRTDEGTAYVVKRWVCRMVDEAKVPREYCTPSQTLLNAAVKAGVREIPGCVVEELEEMRTRA